MKINTQKKLEDIIVNLSTRMTGKSTLLKKGIDNFDRPFFLLVKTIQEGRQLTRNKNAELVTLSNLIKLKGSTKPLIIDQEATLELFEDSYKVVELLKHLSEKRLSICYKLFDLVDQYQERAHTLEKTIIEGFEIKWWQFKKKAEWKFKVATIIKDDFDYQKKFDRIRNLLNS